MFTLKYVKSERFLAVLWKHIIFNVKWVHIIFNVKWVKVGKMSEVFWAKFYRKMSDIFC